MNALAAATLDEQRRNERCRQHESERRCILEARLAEREYEWAMSDDRTLAEASYLERKLSAVQRRYLRAVETLARVRKLMGVPMVQINIAATGGQQVVSNA